MNDLISVIIPVYNVEQYLERCINSILNQSYNKLEIILVNDGSTDNSKDICLKYKNIDNRIKIINQNNGGLSKARNTGINYSVGKYICFIDSDDFIHKDMINILYNNLIKTKSDISMCSFEKVYEEKKDLKVASNYIEYYNPKFYDNLFNNLKIETIISCNKLYKKSLFNGLLYRENKFHEDEFIIHHILKKANKIVYDKNKLYYYYQRENSITNNYSIKNLDVIEALEDRIDFFKELNLNKYYDLTLKVYANTLMYHYGVINNNIKNYKIIKINLRSKFNNVYKKVIFSKNIKIIDKIKIIIGKISPRLFFILCKLK